MRQMKTSKSINYFVKVEALEHPTGTVWVWRVYHTSADTPILQSSIFSDQREAFRLGKKFSEELEIKITCLEPKRDFKIVHGGLE
jgi:hypothetical protein